MKKDQARKTIEAEHREIGDLVGRIEAGSPAEDETLATIRRLAVLLVGHFQREEEKSGFFDQVQERLPQSRAEVERLREQHVEILGQIQRLSQEAEAEPPKSDRELRQAVADLLAAIRAHEQAENELLQKSHYLEYGTKD